MKRAYHLNLLLTFIGFSLGFGFVSAQGVNNIQDSYERGESFLINTFDVDQLRVVPIKGLENPFSLAFRNNGDILVTERFTGKLRLIRDGQLLEGDIEGVPEVYINTGNGYMNIDTSSWPTYSINDGSQGYLFDVDSSGTFDLVMFPLKMNISGDVEIFLSNRHIAN